jgi:hypothetical protein
VTQALTNSTVFEVSQEKQALGMTFFCGFVEDYLSDEGNIRKKVVESFNLPSSE